MKALDKAISAAQGNGEMRRALEAARGTLGEQLERMGLQAPRTRVRAA